MRRVEAGEEAGEPKLRRLRLRHRFHPESEFGGFTDLDGTLTFYARVQELLPPDGTALDIGCGRGNQDEDPVGVRRELRIMRGKCARVIGIDVDPVGAENRFVDEFHLLTPPDPWPVESESVDLAVADFVLEHVADPDHFFGEAARVLRPGGTLGLRTVNRRSYVGLASRIAPSRVHTKVLGRVQPERPSEDVFPTVYRCNTRRALRKALDRAGFEATVYGVENEPDYLGFSGVAYALGLAHRRLAPAGMRVGLVAWAKRL